MLEDHKPTRDDTSEVQESTAENTAPGKVSKLSVWSYVLYNFGNTPFSATDGLVLPALAHGAVRSRVRSF
jgi:hypothetical protein